MSGDQSAASFVPPSPAPAAGGGGLAPRGFPFQLQGRPDFGYVVVQIPRGQTLRVEASAMATMDAHLEMKTKAKGGLGRLLTGESLFLNEFSAPNAGGEIGIAPGPPGDIDHVYLSGSDEIFLQSSSFVACTPGVNVETKWQGLKKGFFSGEKFFLVRCTGTGDLWFNTYGAMFPIDVRGDFVVDTGHIVAFTGGLSYDISTLGGMKALFLSGEGLVCRFRGEGRVWVQSRKPAAFIRWTYPFRPVKDRG